MPQGQITVAASPATTLILPQGIGRKQVTIYNNGPNTMTINRNPDAVAVGLPLATAQSLKWALEKGDDTDKPYFAQATGGTADVRFDWN